MADLFISYRNTPERRQIVRRLALFFHIHGISTWWDYGLEAGSKFESRIQDEIKQAQIVMPLWCFESVFRSKWVIKEATWGAEKLFPIRLQDVGAPASFSHIHSANLIHWDGDLSLGVMDQIIVSLFRMLDRPLNIPYDLRQEVTALPKFEPLPSYPQEYFILLSELRSSYMRVADMPSIDEIQGISFETPLSDLLLAGSNDVYDSIFDILSVNYMLADLEADAIEDLDLDDVTTVGALIDFLIERRSNTASPISA